ncbi:MAG: Tm-1-like ATP-binding domain-containing protein [Anaerolineae bacterium]
MPTVVLMGTLDTKGREYAFVKERLIEFGVTPVVIDFGILGEPAFPPDFSAAEVASAGGFDLSQLRFGREGTDTRARALDVMTHGLIALLAQLRAQGRCDAVMGMGGSGGSSVISAAMRSLPVGVPKLLVSTMASGDVRRIVDTKDLCLMYSVTDIVGLNRVSRKILTNAALAAAGMAKGAALPPPEEDQPLVAITMFGVTTPGVLRLVDRLEGAGFETVVFHAVGSGGRAMEDMITDGLIDGVIDYTLSELTDELLGGWFSAGANRFEAASSKGIPQVAVPGAIEVLNFGPRTSVPEKYDKPERKLIIHNPNVCAVRTTKEEQAELGKIIGQKLSRATGPAAIAFPLQGLDKYEQPPDGPWINAESDGAMFAAIKTNLRPDIQVIELDKNINDPAFADATFELFLQLWHQKHPVAETTP